MSLKNIKTAKDLLAEKKETKRAEINAIRDAKEIQGFMFNGTIFQSDQRSADRLAVAASAATASILMSQPFKVTWTAADNSEHVLDAAGVLAMNGALATHGLTLHETAKQYKNQVDAATTTKEVDAIIWSNV